MNLMRPFAAVAAALALSGLAGCATTIAQTTPPAPAAPSAPAAAAPPAAGASAPAPAAAATPAPPPFATVIRDAKRTDGLLPIWRKDDRIWLELPPAMIDKPLRFSVNISHSLGQRGLVGSTMGPDWLVTFVRPTAQQVQLVALNTAHVAEGAARERALAESFSRSLLASMPVASAPHPESKAVLVDASFLLTDVPSYGRSLEQAFRVPYAYDRANSSFRHAYAGADATTVLTNMHFAVPRLPLPPVGPTPPNLPLPAPPSTLPDARSLFIGFVYNFSRLPEPRMTPRQADGRIGHFFDTVVDFSSDRPLQQRVHYINRWRLEKKDPAAEVSEPVKPITFWLDRTIPPEYRESVKSGILEWNKAFEKIGLRNAIAVQQQPDDAEWHTLDATHASVRWYYSMDPGASASGPSHSDPRTGEILDADIKIGDGWTRILRREAVEQLEPRASTAQQRLALLSAQWQGRGQDRAQYCSYGEEALAEAEFAFDSLVATGQFAPDSPEAEAFVQGYLRHVVMHEVGHTLGLKHNFKASTVYTPAQLRDPAFTAANGVSSSVMDYIATNLPLPGERRAELINRSIGPYDYWAIEYAYRPLDPKTEAEALERIASRSTDPLLAFGDDADADGPGEGIDPLVNRRDGGSDPLAFAERRLALTRELWRRAQEWKPRPGEGALRQRNMLNSGFGQLGLAASVASKFVGGMHTVREVPGTPAAAGRQATFVPVEPAQQRRALDLLAKGLFSADSFRFAPQFVANLAPDFVEWGNRSPISIPAAALRTQTTALDRLMSPGTASRLLELPLFRSAPARDTITLADVYATLQNSIWSELKAGTEIEPMRRNLQREHLRRVQATLLRSGSTLPPDALSLMRYQARRLQDDLRSALARPGRSVETRAHLEDSLSALSQALAASMTRAQ